MAHFKLPLNLPHAGTVAMRIEHFVRRGIDLRGTEHGDVIALADLLRELLEPCRNDPDNPPNADAIAVDAAAVGRRLVDEVERLGIGHDRLGQAVRNLFECLSLGEEGAALSLRAGENPNSALRP